MNSKMNNWLINKKKNKIKNKMKLNYIKILKMNQDSIHLNKNYHLKLISINLDKLNYKI